MLIPLDCEDEEIGLMLKKALQDLKESADDIFDRANRRIDECRLRLSDYRNRLAVVEKKYEDIQQSDEVPLITSPAEFPGKVHLSRPLVFSRCFLATSCHQKTLQSNQCSKPASIKDMVLRKNGYRFIFPKGKHNEALTSKKGNNSRFLSLPEASEKKKGFVRPEDFYSLDMASGYFMPKLHSSEGDDISYSSSGSFASTSLLIYDKLNTTDSTDPFSYKPEAGNLTEFDLPEVLPRLTGVPKTSYAKNDSLFGADQFDDGEGEDIFGHVTKRELDVDLTARSTFYMLDEPASRRSIQSKISTPISTEPSSSGLSTPGQIPILTEPQAQCMVQSTEKPIEPVVSRVPIAPPRSIDAVNKPPPAPPPPMNLLSSIPSPPMPGRADLMEAIRAVGGAKKAGLKKIQVNNEDETTKPPPKKPSSTVGGESTEDLMSSLAKALERRRKGISGKTAKKFEALEKKPYSSTGALSSLRELIPPPSKANDSQSESENEEDWK